MISRRETLRAILVGGFGLSILSSCALITESETMRYRLIVEVETPEGLKSGSSVIEVKVVQNPDWVNPEGRGSRKSYKGEAAAVDLPNGQTIFALFRTAGEGSDASDYPFMAFQDRLSGSKNALQSVRMLRNWKGQKSPMPRTEITLPNGGTEVSAYPVLVTFEDINDPTSVERVDPDDLAANFGAGYKLKSISITITEEPVTTGIENRLGWLGDLRKYRSDPDNPFTSKLSQDISYLRGGNSK
jgi:hypothetical protein